MFIVINRVPNPVAEPPINIISNPIPERKYVSLIRSFLDRFFSSILMNFETSIELKNIATKSEEPNTIDNVMGR